MPPTNPVEYRDSLPNVRPFSPAWCTFVKAVYGVPLNESERPLYAEMSGGIPERPGIGWDEAFANVGRAGGKDDTIASLVNYECIYGGHEVWGRRKQRLPAYVICPLREQAVGTIRMVQGEANEPANKRFVESETADGISYKNGTSAIVQTADAVAVAGDTVVMLVFNEWALGNGDDAQSPIRLVENNARPATRRSAGAPPKRIIKISSSYIREGPAWECYRDGFGRDGDVLVVCGSTGQFNPNIDRTWLAKERKRLGPLAPMYFDAGVWLEAISEGFFPTAALNLAIQCGESELKDRRGGRFVIAADASFSEQSQDKFGWSVASCIPEHCEDNDTVLRETIVHACGAWKVDRGPRQMACRLRDEVCTRFNTKEIVIDQYCDRTFQTICADVGLHARIEAWKAGEGEDSKSQKFWSFRTAMLDGSLLLPDEPGLVHDLTACRSKRLPGGGEKIEVPRSRRGHGDTLSAVVLAATEAMNNASGSIDWESHEAMLKKFVMPQWGLPVRRSL